jgi:N4-gp56 family major capsid protein
MALITTGNLPPGVQAVVDRRMLSVPVPYNIHKLPSVQKYMPSNNGTMMRFARSERLVASLVPLGNTGATPPSNNYQRVFIDAKIEFYGDWLNINEQVTLQDQCPVLNEMANVLGIELREVEDLLSRNIMLAGAGVVNCVNGGNGDSPTNITFADQSRATRALLNASAKTIMQGIRAEDRFGTGPTRAAYLVLAHSNMSAELDAIADFRNVSAYPSPNSILPSEWGALGNGRWFLSPNGSISENSSALGADIYNCFTVGMEATGCVDVDNYGSQFIYRPPYLNDALAQNATVSWKMAEAPVILNESWLLNLRCTLSIPA